MRKSIISMFLLVMVLASSAYGSDSMVVKGRWSVEKAQNWNCNQPWLVGCNFIPSNAINQLEMWQAEMFDIRTLDRELGWAKDIGMNFVRVYLHDMLWSQDKEGFIKRIDTFLNIADKHDIKVMFVLLDGCWDPHPELGKQRAPRPHVHNSGWVQSPHVDVLKEPSRHDELKGYIQGILSKYKDDSRVLLWDLYNEPGNPNAASYGKFAPQNLEDLALRLCKKAFTWAREIDPSQPLSTCVWIGDWEPELLSALNKYLLHNSDVITYHNYSGFTDLKERTSLLLKYNRPLICTEYMSRPEGNTFFAALPFFREYKIGACNWGLVAGKTQTQYPWETWTKKYTAEPKIWFHDVLRSDGRPFDVNEIEFIKFLTGKEIVFPIDSPGCEESSSKDKNRNFGDFPDGTQAKLYSLSNKNGQSVTVTNYGGNELKMLNLTDIRIRDPFVLTVSKENKYYLYGTTCPNVWEGKATGFEAYSSKDMEKWEGPYSAFLPSPDFWADQNFWAPEVYLYNGRYFMFASFKADGFCRATQILVSDSPKGPFHPHGDGPVTPDNQDCLDGTFFQDPNGVPWIIYCCEWTQIGDGKMVALRLNEDLKGTAGDPVVLFRASDAPWVTSHEASGDKYVTDGPFLYRASNGELLMLWSSFSENGYTLGIVRSETGKVVGPWKHDPKPLYSKDGGHGMLFKTFDGQLMLALHAPNISPNERAVFMPVLEKNGQLSLE